MRDHTVETAASPQAVWRVLPDLDQWGSWDPSLEWVRLQGPFRAGSQVVMKPNGQRVVVWALRSRGPAADGR